MSLEVLKSKDLKRDLACILGHVVSLPSLTVEDIE